MRDGDVPPDDARFFQPALRTPSRAELATRRAIEAQVSSFHRAEAKRRGVDEQAVLPGHCAQDLTDALFSHGPSDPAQRDAIARIPGLGACRLSRYGERFLALAHPASASVSASASASVSGDGDGAGSNRCPGARG